PLADLVTPNLGEVRVLTGIDVTCVDDMRKAAEALHALGPRWVLVKGGHLTGPEAVDLLYDGTDVIELVAPRNATPHTHGTGDALGAATTAASAAGADMISAVRAGKAYVTAAVAAAFPLGRGLGPVGHFWRVRDPEQKS